MVTDMVEMRKLIRVIYRHFPPPSCHLSEKPLLQTKGIQEWKFLLRRFLRYRIVPNFTIFDQKRAANCHEHGS